MRHANSNVLLVTHGGCLRALFCVWLGMEISDYAALRFDSASVSQVVVDRSQAIVTQLNDTTHLVGCAERVA